MRSRYYRAPELIFGATKYTTSIDIWSVGYVLAELFLDQPMFPRENVVDPTFFFILCLCIEEGQVQSFMIALLSFLSFLLLA